MSQRERKLCYTMNGRICNVEKNLERCTCSYPGCSRKGYCCDCLQYHWKHQELPGCLFPADAEKTFDRSLENFIDIWSKILGKK
ncbi:MAG: DUF6485 family protein [Candidatus Thorarchaeota archaeon]